MEAQVTNNIKSYALTLLVDDLSILCILILNKLQ